jgi:hypothetical protein
MTWRFGCSRWSRCARPSCSTSESDPFERAEEEAGDYDKWFIEHLFVMVVAQTFVAQYLQTFREFPRRQKPGSYSVADALGMFDGA